MTSSKIPGGAYIGEGRDSLEPSGDNLDDRIINLKFIRKSGRSFIIRSDYEAVHHDDGSISFKKCVEKPDIKVEYRQVAESVAIEVDIEISGFAVGDAEKESAGSMDSVDGDPVMCCIVQMGYRAQFPDWTAPERSGNIAQFYDLNNNAISSEVEVRRGRQILVQILTGYSESYPPDRKIVFKGIIGTMENGLRWNHTEKDLIQGYGDSAFPDGFSEIEEVLFQFITRRFIRPSVLHIAETDQDFTNKEALAGNIKKNFKQKIRIYNHGNKGWKDPPLLDNGIMSVEDANKFGVICTVSRSLRGLEANARYGYGLTPEEAAALNPIPPSSFDDMQDTLGGSLSCSSGIFLLCVGTN
jgi:hypothetical protein